MQTEISRTNRHLQPAHFSLKVETYSLLSEVGKYESGVFEAGGYKWRLIFYPNGDIENNGENHVSLYLAIAETDALPLLWEVNVNFKLFVYDQIEDKYLTVQDANGGVKRFHAMKTTWGFPQLIELEAFKDSSNGYLANDTCLLGAEVLVIKHTGNGESVSLTKAPNISNAKFTWEIEEFSELDKVFYDSEEFTIGGRNWNLKIYPNGEAGYKGKALSLYLMPSDWRNNQAGVYAGYKLRVLDQANGKHYEREVEKCFSAPKNAGFGLPDFISLEDLREPSRGFIMKDSLKVEVEFVIVSETENFS